MVSQNKYPVDETEMVADLHQTSSEEKMNLHCAYSKLLPHINLGLAWQLLFKFQESKFYKFGSVLLLELF
jgi:hypothetical protein